MKKKHIKNKRLQDKLVQEKKLQDNSFADARQLKKLKISLGILTGIFAFLLYVQSIHHSYTLDDHAVTDENKVIKSGITGIPTIFKTDYWYGTGRDNLRGAVYRPTSLFVYAIAWQFFPDNPHVYHFLNTSLYAITCFILFFTLCRMFKKQNLIVAFVCSMLYAAHPIHTEVVNNIKSLDEILCFLFGITSIWFWLKYIDVNKIMFFVLGSASFFLSLISKENGVTFLVIIPLTIYFFTETPVKKISVIALALAAITTVWIILRIMIFKDLPTNNGITGNVLNNTLNAAPDFVSKYATIFYILLRYVILLVFPHPLSCDYNFAQIKIQNLNDPGAFFGLILYSGLAVYSILNLKKKSIVSFGILFFLIALSPTSNLFFLNGATMAERFMYTPSLGFCICLTYYLMKFTKTESVKNKFKNFKQFISFNPAVFSLLFIIILLFSLKTFSRNVYWKDTLTIFSHDIQTSENSATANRILGSALTKAVDNSSNVQDKTDTLNLAKGYLLKSLQIYPGYADPLWDLGNIYYSENNFDSALYYQKRELESDKNNVGLNYIYGNTLNKLKKYDEAIIVLNHVVKLDSKFEQAYLDLAASYTNKGNNDSGFYYLSKLIEVNPQRGDAYYYSGMILKAKGDTAKANEFINKAISLGFKSQ